MHELLAAKAFYHQAVHLRRSPLPFHAEMAVVTLQDAVELAAIAAVKSLGVEIPKQTQFEGYWKLVADAEKGKSAPKTLPLSTEMRNLNSARVAFKHHGNQPNVAQAIVHEDNARRFFVAVAREFFDVDFDSLSEIDLVASQAIRNLLRSAASQIAGNETQSALHRCRDALDEARKVIEPFLQWDRSLRIPSGPRELQPVTDAFNALGRAVILVEFYVEAILLGVHPAERSLLEAFLPKAHGHGRYVHRGPHATPEIAAKCVEAVARFAIAAERFAANAKLEGWGFPDAETAQRAADAKRRSGAMTHTIDQPPPSGGDPTP